LLPIKKGSSFGFFFLSCLLEAFRKRNDEEEDGNNINNDSNTSDALKQRIITLQVFGFNPSDTNHNHVLPVF